MREYFVSDEASRDLKLFGFDKPCIAIKIGENIFYGEFTNSHEEYDNSLILWQQAIDWLEENKIYLYAFKFIDRWNWKRTVNEGYDAFSRGDGFDTKYEALNEGLNKTLEILDEYNLENG
jgi:hypothetical protein